MKRTHLLPPPHPHSLANMLCFPLFFSMCMIVFEQTFSSPVFHLSDYRYAIVGNKSILVPRLDGFEVGNLFNIVLPRYKYQHHLICPSATRAFLRVWLPKTEIWGGLPSGSNNRQVMPTTCAFARNLAPFGAHPRCFQATRLSTAYRTVPRLYPLHVPASRSSTGLRRFFFSFYEKSPSLSMPG